MSTALSPIVAGPLVDRHEHVRRITAAWQKTVANIVESGRLLIEAKDDIGHGGFQVMIRAELPFGPRTSQRLMEIAEDRVLSNTTHVSYLPASWGTLYELTKLPKHGLDLEVLIEDGTINPRMERKHVLALLPAPEKRNDDLPPDCEGSVKPEDETGETTELGVSNTDAAEVSSEEISRVAYKLIQLDIELARDVVRILVAGEHLRLWSDLDTGIESEGGAAPVIPPPKRGRPPGSKNKPKAPAPISEANGAEPEASAEAAMKARCSATNDDGLDIPGWLLRPKAAEQDAKDRWIESDTL
jgi:hypothetical protein